MADTTAVLYKRRKFVGPAEQSQYLIHKMGSQVIGVPNTGPRLVFPRIFQTSAEPVEATRFQFAIESS
jgi:hypothetical protein